MRSLALVCSLAVFGSLVPLSPAEAGVRLATHGPLVSDALHSGPGPGVSDWVECGVAVTPATTNGVSYRTVAVHSEGAHGAVIGWSDRRAGGFQAHASRLDGAGNLVSGWGVGGNAISALDSSLLVSADSDGAGGEFFLYTKGDPQSDWNGLYLQHLTSTGLVATGYPADGITIATGVVNYAGMTSDEGGGIFLYCSVEGQTVRVRHLFSDGTDDVIWPVGGTDTGISGGTFDGVAVPDGTGGVYLAWGEQVAGQHPIAIQRFGPGGPVWAGGGLTIANGRHPSIIRLSDELAITFESSDSPNYLPFIRIDMNATLVGSVVVNDPNSGKNPLNPKLVTDQADGVICIWQEAGPGTLPGTFLAQRMVSKFGLWWSYGGVHLFTTASAQAFDGALPQLVSDGANGAITAWTDVRNGNTDVYAQRVLADGSLAWGADGVEVCVATGQQGYPVIASDGTNGAIVAWLDDSDPSNRQIRAARVLSDGTVSALASLVDAAAEPGVVRLHWYTPDGSVGRATVERAEAGSEFAARGEVEADGAGHLRFDDHDVVAGATYEYRLAVPEGATMTYLGQVTIRVPTGASFGIGSIRPNPAEGALSVTFSLENAAPARLEILDVAGRRVLAREVGVLGPGQHVLRLDNTVSLPAGIYTVRLNQSGRAAVTRAAIVR